jgi:myo-inositol 2-dehydrogenase/D-chiro-inositol 1-dehydrogenase
LKSLNLPVAVGGCSATLVADKVRSPTIWTERYAQAYRSEMEAFIDALAEGKPMPTTVRDGVLALRLAECAVESARTGRAVVV